MAKITTTTEECNEMICAFCGGEALSSLRVYSTDWNLPICAECLPGNEIDAPSLKWGRDDAVMIVATLLKIPGRVAELVLEVATDSNITDGLPTHCAEVRLLKQALAEKALCANCGRELFPEELESFSDYTGNYCQACVKKLQTAISGDTVAGVLEEGVMYVFRLKDGSAYIFDPSD